MATEQETAQQWFDRQFYDVKVKIMTAPVYEAYRRERVYWTEIVAEEGERQREKLRRIASQIEILGEEGKIWRAVARVVARRRASEPEWFQVRDDLDRAVSILKSVVNRPSTWEGDVVITGEDSGPGGKSFTCQIRVQRDLARTPTRWATVLQELLHSFSAHRTPDASLDYPGYEEGVVEQLARLLRPLVLDTLQENIPASIFVDRDRFHLYNEYIEALEGMRQILGDAEPFHFYLSLLEQPLEERWAYLRELASSRSLLDDMIANRRWLAWEKVLQR